MPWSKYCWASGEEVVMARWNSPRPSNRRAPSAHCATLARSGGCAGASVSAGLAPAKASSAPERTNLSLAAPAGEDRSATGLVPPHGLKALAGGRQTLEQRCGAPALAVRETQAAHGLDHPRQPGLLPPEHRAAPVGGKPIAVDVHDIDVTRANGDALIEDAGAFVDQRVQQPVEDLLIRHAAPLDAQLARDALDERRHLRIGNARAPVVAVEALAALLTQAPGGHQMLEDRRPALIGRELACLADRKPHIIPRQVTRGERPHGKAESLDGAIDLLDGCALFEQKFRLGPVVHEHAVADEAIAVAGENGDLAERLAERHHGGDRLGRGALAAHVLQ